MGLYDIAYMLAVPGMTVSAPMNGREMLALLRTAVSHNGPFTIRYPRDASPDSVPPIAEIEPTPYGTWELVRKGSDIAILATGTMVLPSLEAATTLAKDGINAAVVNCRFLKPYDALMLAGIIADHKQVLVVEEGTIVNGFGALMARVIEDLDPTVRVGTHGVPDCFIEQAPRRSQLAAVGLDAAGIARRIRAQLESEALAG
jgi:1-deoxy-D-xylulose-5-phosphate synthase